MFEPFAGIPHQIANRPPRCGPTDAAGRWRPSGRTSARGPRAGMPGMGGAAARVRSGGTAIQSRRGDEKTTLPRDDCGGWVAQPLRGFLAAPSRGRAGSPGCKPAAATGWARRSLGSSGDDAMRWVDTVGRGAVGGISGKPVGASDRPAETQQGAVAWDRVDPDNGRAPCHRSGPGGSLCVCGTLPHRPSPPVAYSPAKGKS